MQRKIGLALAGGGGKGAYEIGVWKALRDYGIDDTVGAVAGASIGALNGVLFALGEYDLALELWTSISPEKAFGKDNKKDENLKISRKSYRDRKIKVEKTYLKEKKYIYYLRYLKERYIKFRERKTKVGIKKRIEDIENNGIFSKEGIINILDNLIDLDRLSYADIECFVSCCVAPLNKPKILCYKTNMDTEYFKLNDCEKEKVKTVLLASSALPLVFGAEVIDDIEYVDGGIVENIPILPLYEAGYKKIIAVHLKKGYIIDKKPFPDLKIIEIVPSEPIGEFFNGTLDFSLENSLKRMELGYKDAVKAIRELRSSEL
ncbi:MAG: patatin-like phospholipase family protein [Clostridium argentinense]|uniref:Patatin-like phospholipase family protein n=1 Tax=Clostridium faecium TaxID=2762223 RepID=A0ABR8YPI6_9CLOT|nr:patatin-like phospholipase family protein [Clostridium faecium]MBD8046116.1 patatin-like phospholipase family protein [Clostridium faecium]MBS5824690.1 patatin-like phospholipase family protein [Clostridium argentinense]MDU1349561.1 patatin-like phospholipase family protein [Clostridium argentinense]